ncbi:Peptidoglycan/LPS O-acetylase OafA/YrhL, contains acyltransferase and SGNH-hydrolase domains [Spirosomataceae bacterium TFI 002]|nr:Peptidoglycan/LPS O-acetylase OafA/YrhL, contains acyltransferase and SGNH-hydrolase domains [Spirosomataceae bacterium TFI 002]
MKKTGYIKSLDGLRFLAVALVLVDHWSGDMLGFPASYLGVCLFFVLSGFLITRILLAAKDKDLALGRGHGFSLKQFYIRRTIRIFPLYYLVLAVLWIISFPAVREHFGVLVSYMTNNYIAYNSQWLGKVDHLWSLAVEEQYYLFFPFVLLFIPFKSVKQLLVGMILLSVGLRAFFFFNGTDWVVPYVLMPTCLDAFGLGGLLAYAHYFQKERLINIFSSMSGLVFSLFLYVSICILLHQLSPTHNWLNTIFLRLSESLFSVFLIGNLIRPVGSVSKGISKMFEWDAFVFIGKISYGVYIFHNLIYNPYHESSESYISKILNKLHDLSPSILGTEVFKLIFLFGITIVLATISWFLVEKPINKLKNKFGY